MYMAYQIEVHSKRHHHAAYNAKFGHDRCYFRSTVSTRSEYPKRNPDKTAPFLAMVTVSQFAIVHLMVVKPYNEEI